MDDLIGNVTDATIDDYVGSPAAVVVFGIANCEGCTFMDGVLADLAPRFNGRVRFGKAKMHVPGACREIKRRFTFETYPTTHFFSNGKLLLTREGVVEPDELAALISDHLLK